MLALALSHGDAAPGTGSGSSPPTRLHRRPAPLRPLRRDLPQRHRDRDRSRIGEGDGRAATASGASARATAAAASAWRHGTTRCRCAGGRAESEVSADTDGLIGGRYRGLLRPSGGYLETAQPVRSRRSRRSRRPLRGRAGPPPTAAAASLLRPGESWNDAGIELARLADTAMAGRPLLHFRLEARGETSQRSPAATPCRFRFGRPRVERGDIYWSPAVGAGPAHPRHHRRGDHSLRRPDPAAGAFAGRPARRAHPPTVPAGLRVAPLLFRSPLHVRHRLPARIPERGCGSR